MRLCSIHAEVLHERVEELEAQQNVMVQDNIGSKAEAQRIDAEIKRFLARAGTRFDQATLSSLEEEFERLELRIIANGVRIAELAEELEKVH
jgi:hypothetical protein